MAFWWSSMVLPIGASLACCFRGYVTRESASHRARLAASLGRARSALVQQIQQSALGIQGANARATARALDLPEAFQDPLRVIARDGSLPPHTGCILPLDVRGTLVHVAIQRPAAAPQIRRMKALGVIATVVRGFLWMAGDRYGPDKLGDEGIPIRRMLDGGVPVALSTDGVFDAVDGGGGDCALGRRWSATTRKQSAYPRGGSADGGAKWPPLDLERGIDTDRSRSAR
jgi:hypothetical protein